MRLSRAAFEQYDFDDPQRDNPKDAGKQNARKEQAGTAGLQRFPRRPLGDNGGAGRRLEMPRTARIVVINLKGLGGDHHRLVMIWAIRSSSDFARLGGLAGEPGFAAAFTGTALANCAAAGFSKRAGMARSALCVIGGSAAACVAGSGARTGTPSGALGGMLAAGAGSADATTAGASAGAGSGGGGGRSGMSAAVA